MEQSTLLTTSDDLYKTLLSQSLARYSAMIEQDISMFVVPELTDTDSVGALVECKERIIEVLGEIKFYRTPEIDLDLSSDIQNAFRLAQQKYDMNVQDVRERHALEMDESREAYAIKRKAAEDAVLGSIAPIKRKHEELLAYSTMVEDLLVRHAIASNEMTIATDINAIELEVLIDRALLTCKSVEHSNVDWIKKITNPLHAESSVAWVYLALMIIVLWMLFPVVGAIYIVYTVNQTRLIYADMESYKIAKALMVPIDFMRYVDTAGLELSEYDPSDLIHAHERELADLALTDPRLKYEQEMSKYRSDDGLKWIGEQISTIRTSAETRLFEIRNRLEELMKSIDEKLDALKEGVPKLGEHINDSAVMNTRYFMALENEIEPIYEDFGLTNLTLVGTMSTVENLLKVLFVNMLLSVRARTLRVQIYDPDYLGQHFSEYMSQDALEYIDVAKVDFNKLCESMRIEVSNNIRKLQTENILEYNKKAEDLGMLTLQHTLYIIASGVDDKILENKAFMEFITYSATYGVFIWIVHNKPLPGTKSLPANYSPQGAKLLRYDFGIGASALHAFEYALENNKPPILDYRGKFMDKILPREQWWTGNSTKGVRARVGLRDGDPAKAEYINFNDSDTHFLTTGSTGSGKSVTIDTITLTMLHEYPPDELMIVYLDLKNSEVSKYTKDEMSRLPHAKIIAGTSDGEYCLSVIDWAMQELQRRAALYSKYKLQKIEDLRTTLDDPTRPDYNPEVHVPRIIIIVDEFKVLFDPSRVPQKIISTLSDKLSSLTLLGRAASIHLWFIAQDMKNTLPPNIQENFSQRGCLRATKAISESILGNPAAGLITEKVGWFYTNNSAGQNEKANRLWKIPYATPAQISASIGDLEELCTVTNKSGYGARLYDENLPRLEQDFYIACNENPDIRRNGMRFIMGERTVYSEKSSPFNILFRKDEKENLVSIAFELKNMLDIISTFVYNINNSDETCQLLINSADRDTISLLELDKRMPEGWEDFIQPNYPLDYYLDDIEEIIETREAIEYNELHPLYVMNLCWERKEGISVDESYSHVTRLIKLMSRGNQCKVHFLYIGREHGLPNRIGSACNHKLAAKADSRSSTFVLNDDVAEKLRTPEPGKASFAVYKFGSEIRKFKIYEFPIVGKIEERDIG